MTFNKYLRSASKIFYGLIALKSKQLTPFITGIVGFQLSGFPTQSGSILETLHDVPNRKSGTEQNPREEWTVQYH